MKRILRNKYIKAIILMLAIVAYFTIPIVGINKINNQKEEILELKAINISLSEENIKIKGELTKSIAEGIEKENYNNITFSALEFVTDKFDRLEELTLENDDMAHTTIEWFRDNALFLGDQKAVAYGIYTRWSVNNEKLADDYTDILLEIEEAVNQLNGIYN